MKRNKGIIFFIFTLFILTACNRNSGDCTNGIQDGDETGIDCGGICPSCYTPVSVTNNNTTDNNPPAALTYGIWYENYTLSRGSVALNGYNYVSIHNDSVTIDFTSSIIPSSTEVVYQTFVTPTATPPYSLANLVINGYTYSNNRINNNLYLYLLTCDSLIVENNILYVLSRQHTPGLPLTMGGNYTVQWEFNLSAPYNGTDTPEVAIYYENTKIQSVPITSNQLNYSGIPTFTLNKNISYTNPMKITMRIQPTAYSGFDVLNVANARLTFSNVSVRAGAGTYCSMGGACGNLPTINGDFLQLIFD